MKIYCRCVMVVVAILVAGCSSRPAYQSTGDIDLAKRSAGLRATANANWEALGLAIKNGDQVHPGYVYYIADMRYAALATDLQTAMLPVAPQNRAKARETIDAFEKLMPKVLALPRTQDPAATLPTIRSMEPAWQ